MSTQATQPTAAQRVADSTAISGAIDTIINEMEAAQAHITGVRPPTAELVEEYRYVLERLGAVRGRGSFYPYIGSGSGRGALVELADGSVKWDLINGIGVHMFGHGDLDLAATALRAAMGDTVMQGNLQCNADALEFAELLLTEASRSSGLRHCFVTNSGAMANESALKIAMQKREGRAPRVLAFTDCFMGRSLTMAQIGDNPSIGTSISTAAS
jgi:4-aminobutyrate aminotransferase-like enzyme